MISTEKIVFNEPIYFTPNYNGAVRVSILKLLDDGRLLVKQHFGKKDLKPFPTPIVHVYNSSKDAAKGRRAWEASKRKKAKGAKK